MIKLISVAITALVLSTGCLELPKPHASENPTFPLTTTSGELKNNLVSAGEHAAKADQKLTEGIALVENDAPKDRVLPPLRESKSELTQTREDLAASKARAEVLEGQLKTAISRVETLITEKLRAETEVGKLKAELVVSKDETKAAKVEYHEAWLGGKAWRTIYWITGISIAILVVSLILNAKTNLFVTPLQLAGKSIVWLFTPKSTS